ARAGCRRDALEHSALFIAPNKIGVARRRRQARWARLDFLGHTYGVGSVEQRTHALEFHARAHAEFSFEQLSAIVVLSLRLGVTPQPGKQPDNVEMPPLVQPIDRYALARIPKGLARRFGEQHDQSSQHRQPQRSPLLALGYAPLVESGAGRQVEPFGELAAERRRRVAQYFDGRGLDTARDQRSKPRN